MMKQRASRFGFIVLALYIAISFSYYAAGVLALREEWFHAAKYARSPIDIQDHTQAIVRLEKEAKAAGLSVGDVVRALNGQPFTGDYQLLSCLRQAHPGDP